MFSLTHIIPHGKLVFLDNKVGLSARRESLLEDFRPPTPNAISLEGI
jgi:hypothetical protein